MKLPAFLLLLCLLGTLAYSCKETGMDPQVDNFDRSIMLANWADNIIIPAYESYEQKLDELSSAKNTFISNPSESTLDQLRLTWLEAYKGWQQVSMFEIGKAEAINLRNYSNIFPCDTAKINDNIQTGSYNLELPSNYVSQGFPALDFLLYGLSNSKSETVSLLSSPEYAAYLGDLVDRLANLNREVLKDWQTGYRDDFVSNSGSSATSSVDKLVNDYLFYFEKFLRAGKIGIPAGVFSGSTLSQNAEVPYAGVYSKELFDIALDAVQDFFNGKAFESSDTGESLKSYLDYIQSITQGENLSAAINGQFNAARNSATELKPNLKEQIEEDNSKMLETYDELQKAVVLLKVDMMQALNIRVDFVDADGD